MSFDLDMDDIPALASGRLCLIAARGHGGVIGAGGTLPWHIPEDLKFFKAQTRGKTVIMGRATYQSIGRPLPQRRNIVVSRTWTTAPDGVDHAVSLDDALDLSEDDAQMIIGGAQLYCASIERAARLILTEVDMNVSGDTFFPDFDMADFREIWRRDLAADGDRPGLAFRILDRI